MNKLFNILSSLAALAFILTACTPPAVDVAQAAPAQVSYQAMLGKPLTDRTVADFIASNDCSPAGSFHLCKPAGLAFWRDGSQTFKTAYLYVSNSEGFASYKGELPLDLAAGDTMADVEEKLGQPKEIHALQAGWALGLPDEGSSPDRTHYWAVYKRFGLTIIYNSPLVSDKNATIHAILVNQ